MPSKTPRRDELRKKFDAFLSMPPTSNVHWEGMARQIETALAEATSAINELRTAGNAPAVKDATDDAEAINKLKAEFKRAREAFNEGLKTR